MTWAIAGSEIQAKTVNTKTDNASTFFMIVLLLSYLAHERRSQGDNAEMPKRVLYQRLTFFLSTPDFLRRACVRLHSVLIAQETECQIALSL